MTLPTLGGAMTALSVARLVLHRLRAAHAGQPALQATGCIARVMLSAERDMAQ